MSIFTKAKKVVGKIMGKQEMVDDATRDEENQALLDKWKPVFEVDKKAKKEWDTRFDGWESMYQGSRDFGNTYNTQATAQREMRTNVNFPRMIIESLIDLNVPDPEFKAVAKDDEQPIQMLEDYVKYIVRAAQPSLDEINLHNERRVMKFGGAFWKIHWENNIKKAGYVGEIGISMPHPKDIIPNHGATSTDDMEHYHHPVNRTANEIIKKWPNITENELEQFGMLYKEYDELTGSHRITVSDQQSGDKEMGLQKYTVIETTYKDGDGDICKLWWTGDLLLKHLPKFYYRRNDGEIATTEEYEGKQVEYYIPQSWDLIYQPFIPRDKCFWGISLMEDIYDLNEAIKKAVHIHEEQHLKGQKKILVGSQGLKIALESSVSTVEYVPDPTTMVREIDMSTDLDGVAWIEKLKEWMQLLTGATNATLGVRDSSVNSAKQAQVYIEQANFKVALKTAYKSSCYKRIFRTIADFSLAFIDETRPYRLEGQTPKPQQNPDGTTTVPKALYGEFSRLNMLKDQSGNYIYPDYDIEVNAEAVFLKSKSEIFNALVTLAGQGRFEPNAGNVAFLKILNKIGVPDLQEVIDSMEQDIQQQKEMAMANASKSKEKGPAESIAFKDLPATGKIQMAAQAGIQLSAEDLAQLAAIEQQAKQSQVQAKSKNQTQSEGSSSAQQVNNGQTQAQGSEDPLSQFPGPIQKLLQAMDPDKAQGIIKLIMAMDTDKREILLSSPDNFIKALQQIAGGSQ